MKIKILFVICMAVLIFSGCGGEELENKSFALTLGFDIEDEHMQIIYDFPDLTSYTDQSKGSGGGQFIVDCGKFETSISTYEDSSDKLIDFAHLKCIILSRNFIEDEEYYNELLEYLEKEEIFADNIPIVVTEEKITDLITNAKVDGGSIGEYLARMISNQEEKQNIKYASLSSLIKRIYDKAPVYIPVLTYKGELIMMQEYLTI